jgi:Ni/Fe-hydrogenase b-type cytochrome subunit
VESFAYRHNRVTRLTHWINTIVLTVLFMSGLQIFNAFPHLHWGDKAEPGEAFLSIYASNEDGEIRGYIELFGYRIDTTGVLGLQYTDAGPLPRGFPSWSTIPGYFWLAGGRRWHFFFAWLFALNGILYLIYNLLNGHMRKFLFTRRDAANVPPMILYYLRLRRESPQQGEYNPLQKMAYTGVFAILTPLVVLSGLAMSPQLNVAFNWLPAMFGGRQAARSVHFILSFAFVAFTFGHVFMVLTTGVLNNMRSMTTGWHKEKISPQPGEPVRLETFKEGMIEKHPKIPAGNETPRLEEKGQPPTEAVQEDNTISKSESKNEGSTSETSSETSPAQSKEEKKDVSH